MEAPEVNTLDAVLQYQHVLHGHPRYYISDLNQIELLSHYI